MENQQPIDQFDAMLRQSLDGAKLNVPGGVWESVSTSVGAKVVVASKIAAIKLLIIKSAAVLLVAGGVGFGAYMLLSDKQPVVDPREEVKSTSHISNDGNQIAPSIVEEESVSGEDIVKNKLKTSQNSPIEESIPTNPNFKQPLAHQDTFKSPEKSNPSTVITETKHSPNENPKGSTIQETPKENIKPVTKETKTETKPSYVPLEIPNVFTPYDLDEINDCFKIPIENESLFSLQIFDESGLKVFETTDKNECWNGKNSATNQMCPRGFYTYKLMYELKTGYKRRVNGGLNLL